MRALLAVLRLSPTQPARPSRCCSSLSLAKSLGEGTKPEASDGDIRCFFICRNAAIILDRRFQNQAPNLAASNLVPQVPKRRPIPHRDSLSLSLQIYAYAPFRVWLRDLMSLFQNDTSCQHTDKI